MKSSNHQNILIAREKRRRWSREFRLAQVENLRSLISKSEGVVERFPVGYTAVHTHRRVSTPVYPLPCTHYPLVCVPEGG